MSLRSKHESVIVSKYTNRRKSEGFPNKTRCIPDVFPMYHYVTTNLNPNNLSTETCESRDYFEFDFDFYS